MTDTREKYRALLREISYLSNSEISEIKSELMFWEKHNFNFNTIRAEKMLLKLKEQGIKMTRNNDGGDNDG